MSAGSKTHLLELLRKLAFERREVILSSGKRSDFYIDCKQASLHPQGALAIGQNFFQEISQHCPQVEAVGGMSIGADPLATATSLVSTLAGWPRAAFLIRKTPKGHGTDQWVEGMANLHKGMPVAILEDVVTTGASTIRAIECAKQAGLEVIHCFALVDRCEENGAAAIEAHAPLTSLFRRGDFL